jgi:hypothetical protein
MDEHTKPVSDLLVGIEAGSRWTTRIASSPRPSDGFTSDRCGTGSTVSGTL